MQRASAGGSPAGARGRADDGMHALMARFGITRAAALDDDFAIYRFGPRRERAFEIVR